MHHSARFQENGMNIHNYPRDTKQEKAHATLRLNWWFQPSQERKPLRQSVPWKSTGNHTLQQTWHRSAPVLIHTACAMHVLCLVYVCTELGLKQNYWKMGSGSPEALRNRHLCHFTLRNQHESTWVNLDPLGMMVHSSTSSGVCIIDTSRLRYLSTKNPPRVCRRLMNIVHINYPPQYWDLLQYSSIFYRWIFSTMNPPRPTIPTQSNISNSAPCQSWRSASSDSNCAPLPADSRGFGVLRHKATHNRDIIGPVSWGSNMK